MNRIIKSTTKDPNENKIMISHWNGLKKLVDSPKGADEKFPMTKFSHPIKMK